jgi:hypothetical protein
MEVTLSKHAGFCHGVARAVKTALEVQGGQRNVSVPGTVPALVAVVSVTHLSPLDDVYSRTGSSWSCRDQLDSRTRRTALIDRKLTGEPCCIVMRLV